MRFSSLLDRTEAKELTQEAAAELLGMNVRTFQRWAERFEAEGDDRLVDQRMGRRSQGSGAGGGADADAGAVPGQVCIPLALQKQHGYMLGYAVTTRLARCWFGAEGAEAFGAPQEASTPSYRGCCCIRTGRATPGSKICRRWT